MQKAKASVFVCAGIFLLALSYHLGASSATAQSEITENAGFFALVVDRVPHRAQRLPFTPIGPLPPIPGTAPVVEYGNNDWAMLANGDVYQWTGSAWHLEGNLFGGTTPVQPSTFGSIKARYR